MNGRGLRIMFNFVEEISFEEIEKIWKRELWPDKKNGIAKANEWTWLWYKKNLGKDKQMVKDVEPTFIGLRSGKELVAVNSCYQSNKEGMFVYWRSRGLWVHPDFRRQKYSSVILTWCLEYAKKQGGTYMWTCPRQSALPAYKSVGFIKTSEWFEDGQYGPNCIAYKYL
jgi:GNAT superfamily N-acetyltransferase